VFNSLTGWDCKFGSTTEGAHAAAACEALQLGKQLGLTDLDKLLDVLGNSWGQSKILNRCGRLIADSEKKVGTLPPFLSCSLFLARIIEISE
jgi:hypothetical protein